LSRAIFHPKYTPRVKTKLPKVTNDEFSHFFVTGKMFIFLLINNGYYLQIISNKYNNF